MASGALTTTDGYAVQTTGGQTLQTKSQALLDVGPDGTITQDGAAVGQLQLVDFQDRSVLQKKWAMVTSASPTRRSC